MSFAELDRFYLPLRPQRLRRSNSVWTDEKIERLKLLWEQGLASRTIADELGDDLTRNAIVGKAHRLGLPKHKNAHSRVHRAPRQPGVNSSNNPKRAATKSGAKVISFFRYTHGESPVHPTDYVIPIGQRKKLMELTNATCKWPIGDPGPDLYFCGDVTVPERPYCIHHCCIAYQPPEARRAR